MEMFEYVGRHYPDMNITQLGMVCLLLGGLRSTMGHEDAKGTVDNYIHPQHLSPEVRQCLDFLEREVLSIKKSKMDIDHWKRGNVQNIRRNEDKQEIPREDRKIR